MDIRNLTTQKRIQAGLIEVLKDKSLVMCKVTDILEAAQVSKKTFYTYYKSKDELALAIEDNLISGLKHSLELDRQSFIHHFDNCPVNKSDQLADTFFDHTMKYCDEHKDWFINLLSSNGDIRLINRVHKIGNEEITKRLAYAFHLNYDQIKENNSELFLAVKMLYSDLVIDLAIFWMANSEGMSISEVKSLIGIVQTRPFVKLISYFRKNTPSA